MCSLTIHHMTIVCYLFAVFEILRISYFINRCCDTIRVPCACPFLLLQSHLICNTYHLSSTAIRIVRVQTGCFWNCFLVPRVGPPTLLCPTIRQHCQHSALLSRCIISVCSLGTDTSSKFGLLLRLESRNTISTCSIPVRTHS